ncbi:MULTISPECIES: DUF899 family protein [Rhizobium]|uniref:Putative dithiol-disulfide oxidoreductase (DUF899 family) n=1 Tax=Rhizobium paranaense TaxID=1650438 RepID=A0A7W8XRP5_9HYPH|nr:DUF899 family protein [Rhizobium paranaense]MBB5574321.1 putative dithiol-disulfide oxidoreductase (DUF899 family) [Rhizobium paranaense]
MINEDGYTPAAELAQKNGARFPNETNEYRQARNALLAEEIELRRHIERVAAQRRALPPGGIVKKRYQFISPDGPVDFENLFDDKETLLIYSYMFGPERTRPCPMCTSFLSALEGEVLDIEQRMAIAVVARSPIEKLLDFKTERHWQNLPLYSDPTGEYSRDYRALGANGNDNAAVNVFTRRDGTIRHFWSEEMGPVTADPGQDPRGAPDLMPLWTILDMTPEGRARDWYPKLTYGHA